MPYLLNISLGPVQDFIASARRCQDLWYGSWLLSELSSAAAEHLRKHGAKAIIFPGGLAQAQTMEEDASVANKILAIIPGDASRVRESAEGARGAMLAKLESLAEPVFKAAFSGLSGAEVTEALLKARHQMMDLMEFQWVAVPYDDHTYGSDRAEVERLLMAAKNTKPWNQPAWSQQGWCKSSLDGLRETVIPDLFFQVPDGRSAAAHAEWLYRQFKVRPNERLCGVGLLKRWGFDATAEGGRRRRFHSTSHMAAAPLRERAAAMQGRQDVQAAWAAYQALLVSAPFHDQLLVDEKHPLFGHYDGSVLYPNRLREAFFSSDDARMATGPHADTCAEAEQALKALLGTLEVAEPNAYYALLLADGDHMGAAIDHQQTVEAHQAISQALDAFAKSVKDIVLRHGGSLIYSGGDDVLAMLPLHRCLDCAEELARGFAERLAGFTTKEKLQPTLSVGVAIAHHLENFAEVRGWAGQAEKRAKNNGRNSLALRLEKRGGSPVEVCGKWPSTPPEVSHFLGRMREWISLQAEGNVPNKLPFQWAELVRLAKDNPDVNELAMLEARRLLERKSSDRQGVKLVSAIQAYLDQQTDPAVLEALSQELVLAKELGRALRQAEEPSPQLQETL